MPRTPTVRQVPKGLLYQPEFLAPEEQADLVRFVESLDYGQVEMRGRAAKRQVRHFGYLYGYESWTLEPTDSVPEELGSLRERCGALASVSARDLDEVLVTRYPPGAGIGWHRDAPMFGPKVIGVSLRSEARMRFQRKAGGVRLVHDLLLAPGSAYVLADEVRRSWQHSIPAVNSVRYSITFRTVRDKFRQPAPEIEMVPDGSAT